MMVAHLYIPVYDNTPNQASTLSPKIVNGLLKDSLGFEGLIFTDALNMKGVSKYYQPGEVDVKALLAGNDILLFPENVPVAIQGIKAAIAKGQISQAEIDARCLKILRAKSWVGLDNMQPIRTKNLVRDLTPIKNEVLNHKFADQSITLLQNLDNHLPIKRLDSTRIAYLNIGGTKRNEFYQSMNHYATITEIQIPRTLSAEDQNQVLQQIKAYDQVIVGFHRTNNNPKRNFGISYQSIALLNTIAKEQPTVAVVFGNPYALAKFKDQSHTAALVVTYQDTKYTRKSAGELIFGGITPQGKLPVSCGPDFPAGMGLSYDKTTRLHFALPAELGIPAKKIKAIDLIAQKGIRLKAYPGCQVLAIKNGTVFYNKSFGHHTYQKKRKVKSSDLYDIASITKIAATTYTLMYLSEHTDFSIDKTLGDYIPDLVNNTPYQHTVIRHMLAHQAGFVSWIPFYNRTLKDGQPDPQHYASDSSTTFPIRVSENLFITPIYKDSIFTRITSTSLRRKRYKYSDIGYYFLKEVIEKETKMPFDQFVAQTFYKPLGLSHITYKPTQQFDKSEITPTENDTIFRHELVHGHVHDPGAAMLGGVGGHAGLFANALDLGTLMYTLINDGTYGGDTLLSAQTIQDFTRCQFCPNNRRGAGFDKPVRSLDGGPTCKQVSLSSFWTLRLYRHPDLGRP